MHPLIRPGRAEYMTKGLYGARDFHKHGWKLPIPRYDGSNPLHIRLRELSTTAEQKCQALIAQSDIMSKPAGKAQSRAARSLLRHELQPSGLPQNRVALDRVPGESLKGARRQQFCAMYSRRLRGGRCPGP